MIAQVSAIYEQIGKSDFKNDKGETIEYNELLVRDPDITNPRFAMVGFSVPNEVYDKYPSTQLESFKGKTVLLSGQLLRKYTGGLRFVVEKIELQKGE